MNGALRTYAASTLTAALLFGQENYLLLVGETPTDAYIPAQCTSPSPWHGLIIHQDPTLPDPTRRKPGAADAYQVRLGHQTATQEELL